MLRVTAQEQKQKIFREAVELHCRRLITRQRDMMLMRNNFTFVITDYEAVKRDGVHDLLDEEKYYTLATYEENEFKYAFTIGDYGVTAVEFDVTEIVNDWFAA